MKHWFRSAALAGLSLSVMAAAQAQQSPQSLT